MDNKYVGARSLVSLFVVFALNFVLALIGFSLASPVAFAQGGGSQRPTVKTAVKFDVSPPLSEIAPLLTTPERKVSDDPGPGPIGNTDHDLDPLVQTTVGSGVFNQQWAIPTATSFEGIAGTAAPPDPNGDIGPNHYVQMVNVRFQIFTRTGTSVFGPASINTLFSGFGGPCQTENAGDPVVLYDQLADRWLLSQFSDGTAPFFNCVAISTTGNPLGTYYRYAFSAPAFPDYPKYGVWPDGYYLNTRESGAGVVGMYALEREQMILGNPAARAVRFTVAETGAGPNGLLPSDIDGSALPPAGSPNFFVGTRDDGFGNPADALTVYKFHVDWANTANSTFTGPTVVPIAPFDSIFPCTPTSRACIPQPGTANKIDILSYRKRPTFRLAYRNFGTHESLVTTQSVEAAVGIAGMRWWELRDPNGTPTVFQEGTYAPGVTDTVHRWMGSIAMDRQGNMGLGYSVSNATDVFPGIRYTGRLSTDPPGTMPQGEATVVNGTGSQTGGGNRWGDYTSMNIDSLDDCTFWYTNEYYAVTASVGWRTRIASFTFPDCRASIPRSRADFDGDGRTDLSVFRPSEGNWYLNRSGAGLTVQQWGLNGDTPIPGDFDGDQKTDIAVYRGDVDSTKPDFYVLRSSTGTFSSSSWGLPADLPMSGDFDGDQKTDLAVFRPSNSTWYILSSTGTVQTPNFGSPGDIPFVMDYEGDGLSNISVFRPSDRTWYIAKPTGVPAQNFYAIQFGLATDMPVPADYDGDNKDDLAVFRPETGTWFVLRSTNGAVEATQFGLNRDVPVPGDYDGDGRDDLAVYREGIWYLNRSTTGLAQFNFGVASDRPIPRSYIP